jgi:phosphoserine phosphatase RsbU/P
MGLMDSQKKTNSKTQIKDLKLSILLEVTKAINHNFSTQHLLDIYEDVLRNKLNIGKLVLFSLDEQWTCLLKYGVGAEHEKIDVEKELKGVKEIGTINFHSPELENSFEIVIPVFHKAHPLAYVLISDLEDDKLELSAAIKHLPFVQTLTNIIIVAIENKKLYKENIQKAALNKELELASQMQHMLFPETLPDNEIIQVDALYLPHQQVGGDYYDLIWLNDNEFAFCMADVSGKGVAAALLMSNFQANLRVLLNYTSSLKELVNQLNRKVMLNAKGEKFITFFIGRYNTQTRVLSYINAGHNPPVLFAGKNPILLKAGCTGLGMFEELSHVKEGFLSIPKNSFITCYTDGVVEVENEDNDNFGAERLIEIMRAYKDNSARGINQQILFNLVEFKGIRPYVDDIALFSCRIY